MHRVTAKEKTHCNEISFLLKDHLAATCFAGDLRDHMEDAGEVVISIVNDQAEDKAEKAGNNLEN